MTTGLIAVVLVALGCSSRENYAGGMTGNGNTLFGSTVDRAPGESLSEALARIQAKLGPLPLVRIYASGLPPSWSELRKGIGRVSTVVSFKADPSEVLSGAYDARLRAWFQAAPTHRDTWWVYYHEPENNVKSGHFTAEQFRAAWMHVAAIGASVDNPLLHPTLVLMCFTLQPESGRDWNAYVPEDGSVAVLAWDCYNQAARNGQYVDPSLLLGRSVEASRAAGAAWGIAELGSRIAEGDDGTARAVWLRAVAGYAIDNQAEFVTYFDSGAGGGFHLSDEPSITAWRAFVTG